MLHWAHVNLRKATFPWNCIDAIANQQYAYMQPSCRNLECELVTGSQDACRLGLEAGFTSASSLADLHLEDAPDLPATAQKIAERLGEGLITAFLPVIVTADMGQSTWSIWLAAYYPWQVCDLRGSYGGFNSRNQNPEQKYQLCSAGIEATRLQCQAGESAVKDSSSDSKTDLLFICMDPGHGTIISSAQPTTSSTLDERSCSASTSWWDLCKLLQTHKLMPISKCLWSIKSTLLNLTYDPECMLTAPKGKLLSRWTLYDVMQSLTMLFSKCAFSIFQNERET